MPGSQTIGSGESGAKTWTSPLEGKSLTATVQKEETQKHLCICSGKRTERLKAARATGQTPQSWDCNDGANHSWIATRRHQRSGAGPESPADFPSFLHFLGSRLGSCPKACDTVNFRQHSAKRM